MFLYEYELGKAASILAGELFKLKPGETFVITADTESDMRVVNATARAGFSLDAKPIVIVVPSPRGVGKLADPTLPVEALVGALGRADAWVEFNNKWLLYSTPHETVMRENKKLRYLCLVGMNADMMIRCVGRIDHPTLRSFLEMAAQKIRAAGRVHMTSPGGTDLEFGNIEGRSAMVRDGYADRPGTHMMSGFIAWAPDLESVNGTLVFDGSVVPPCGRLEAPIRCTIEAGKIVEIRGAAQARQLREYLHSLDHPQMLKLAHASFGFHPGARLTGDIVEDERIWGCTEWGIGHVGAHLIPPDGIPAPSHTDGQSLDSTVTLDGRPLTREGEVVDPELRQLAMRFGK